LKIEVKYNTKLDEIQRGLALPLVEIATDLLASMEVRIDRGEAATGKFRAVGMGSKPKNLRARGLWWVRPSLPHPPGYVVKPTHGPHSGWAGYLSYWAYCEALGSPSRTFFRTGQLRNSRKIRVMGPGRVRIAHYGGRTKAPDHRGQTHKASNSEVAFLASRLERDPMLMPTRGEFDEMRATVIEHYEALVAAGAAQSTRAAKRGKARRPATPGRR
jgi:hypothetical protein